MLLLTLAAAALAQPVSTPMAAAFGDVPIVCNPDSSKARACHADRHHAQIREQQARKQRLAEARALEQNRAAGQLSMQDTAGRPVSD